MAFVLTDIITSNHIHLLVRDRGQGGIKNSMQLVSGRTAQEYNQRKVLKGAFWEDSCMVYIELNMVRAGVVSHPVDWPWCGYCEIQSQPQCYALIDRRAFTELLGINNFKRYQQLNKGWIENELKSVQLGREPVWTQSLAVWHKDYVQDVKLALGMAAPQINSRRK